ncbi:unnamed protein product [Dibothriocephalus latus]|uniref:Uncharacterized protein n=1 Tax=Dibothriocephalus latus TaxID=60516 RepID=A0A3P7KYR4_DIBLA|nr:unnamed protein product [Dibothriocephalus latus]
MVVQPPSSRSIPTFTSFTKRRQHVQSPCARRYLVLILKTQKPQMNKPNSFQSP